MNRKLYFNEVNNIIRNAGYSISLGWIPLAHLHVVISTDGTVYPDLCRGILAPLLASRMSTELLQSLHTEELERNSGRELKWNSYDTALKIH